MGKMLCGVVIGPSLNDVQEEIEKASCYADMLEIRWDCLNFSSLEFECKLPMIFTLRPFSQDGFYNGNEDERLQKILRLAAFKPAYIDLEYTVPSDFIKKLK